MKDLKSGNGSQDALLLAETGSSSAISPNSISDPVTLPTQLATLRAFSNNPLDSSIDTQTLASLHSNSNRAYTSLFPSPNTEMTNDQFLKAAKLLGIGLNSTTSSASTNQQHTAIPNSLLVERSLFHNEDLDLNEISEFIDQLSIVNCLNNDEKVLNAAICILFNGLPLTLLNPGNVAEEIYSSKFD